MPDTYTHEDFSVDVLPRGVSKTDRDTISRAVEIGWKLMVTNRGHMTIIGPPPNDHVKFNITQSRSKGRGEGPVKQVRRKIEQLADPELLAIADGKPEPKGTAGVQTLNPVISPEVAKAALAKIEEPLVVEREPVIDPEIGVKDRTGDRHIVSEVPMVANAGTGRGYISPTTIQRTWSDGSVDFGCAFEGCDFSSEKRQGIGPHWRAHVNRGEAEHASTPGRQERVFLVTDHVATERNGYTPRADRIAALAADLRTLLEEGIDWSDLDNAAKRLAEEALHWDHRQSVTRSGLASEREPLTAEQTLDRIRAMIDGGLYLQQQQRIDELLSRHEEERLAREEAEARAQKAHDTLRAFRELAAEATD